MSQASGVLPGPDGAGNAVALSLDDLNTTINHEPRISHRRLAMALGYQQPNNLLRLVKRSMPELSRYGEVSSTVEETGPKGGRPGVLYFLNEAQAILVTIKSDAPRAPDARQEIIEVFLAYRCGQIAPPAPERLPPHPRAVPRKDGRYLVVVCGGRIGEVKDVRDACIVNGADPMNVRTFLREYVSVEVLPVAMEMIASRTAVALHQHLTGSPFAKRSGQP